MEAPPTWHADAVKVADLVQAGGLVQAGVGHALVDVQLAACAHVARLALALEGSFGVQALPSVLTRVGAWRNTLSNGDSIDTISVKV